MARYLHFSGPRLYLTMASRSASCAELKWVRELKKSHLTNLQSDGKSDDPARHREQKFSANQSSGRTTIWLTC